MVYFAAINYYLFATTFMCLYLPIAYSNNLLDRRAQMLLNASPRRRIGPELLFLYKQRVRRAEVDCSNEAENNAELQKSISSMIIGNDDKSYFTQHRHRSKINHEKSALCEEDNGPDEILPDSPIKDRALCTFVYIENVNEKRLPRTIPEVQCACSKPTNRNVLSRFPQIRCEAVYYSVPVIKFGDSCSNYEKTTERVSLACLPVLSSQSSSKLPIESGDGQESELPSK